jgi:hypothetical protein
MGDGDGEMGTCSADDGTILNLLPVLLKASVAQMHWYIMWKWLRTAPTLAITRQRLDVVLSVYPSSHTYIAFLWNNVSTWATCVRTGKLTFNYAASSHQESSFATIKGGLNGKNIALQAAPDYICYVLTRRAKRIKRTANSDGEQRKLSDLVKQAQTAGCTELTTILSLHCTAAATHILLTQLHDACLGYTATPISGVDDANNTIHKTLERRGAWALYFKCIVESDNHNGSFFRVFCKASSTVDVVYVTSNGSVACTSDYYTNMGIFGKHILAVFIAGYLLFNPLYHLHPVYVLPHVFYQDKTSNTVMSVAAHARQSGIAQVCDSGSWNYCVNIGRDRWKAIGHNGALFHQNLHPTIHAIKCQPESREEKDRKLWHRAIEVASLDKSLL